MTRILSSIYGWVSAISLFLGLGIVGSMDMNVIEHGTGALLIFLFLSIFAVTTYKGGYVE